jgi:hypothetical protein
MITVVVAALLIMARQSQPALREAGFEARRSPMTGSRR